MNLDQGDKVYQTLSCSALQRSSNSMRCTQDHDNLDIRQVNNSDEMGRDEHRLGHDCEVCPSVS